MNEAIAATANDVRHFDVLIVGAGISGIGSAWHVQDQCPDKSYVVLEAKESFGGTWETHKYPGCRSDSDLYTYGYRFKPWAGAPIASRDEILNYLREVVEDAGIADHIRFGHRITSCRWSSAESLWTVEAKRTADGAVVKFTASFLSICAGCYDHETPNIPEWPTLTDYKGTFVHAQQWDPATDYSGKRILVIGSGATAATIVPAFAEKATHVTMLQRSPTYFYCSENRNELAERLQQIGIDDETTHRVVRAQVLHDQDLIAERCLTEPDKVFEDLKDLIRAYSGDPDFKFEPHFIPRYRPWQQRLAFCPEGDIFRAVTAGKLTVVTDTIDRFTETGLLTTGGEEIEADIIVAATGFNMLMMGGIPFEVDGAPVDWAETVGYRSMMMTGVPNLFWVMGYFRASWTLRVDIMGDFMCRLLRHMDHIGAKKVEVALRPEDADMAILPWIEEDNFNAGYLLRSLHEMPRRGDKPEWRHNQDHRAEFEAFPAIDLADPVFIYDGRSGATSEAIAAE